MKSHLNLCKSLSKWTGAESRGQKQIAWSDPHWLTAATKSLLGLRHLEPARVLRWISISVLHRSKEDKTKIKPTLELICRLCLRCECTDAHSRPGTHTVALADSPESLEGR